jgi:hypothetical protein
VSDSTAAVVCRASAMAAAVMTPSSGQGCREVKEMISMLADNESC